RGWGGWSETHDASWVVLEMPGRAPVVLKQGGKRAIASDSHRRARPQAPGACEICPWCAGPGRVRPARRQHANASLNLSRGLKSRFTSLIVSRGDKEVRLAQGAAGESGCG